MRRAHRPVAPASAPAGVARTHRAAKKRVLLPLVALVLAVCACALPACGKTNGAAAGSDGSAAAEAAKYQQIGNPTFGYISVPKDWVEIDTREVSSGDGSTADSLSQGIYYADSDGADATAMMGMLSYGAFDHELDDKVADEFVTSFEGMGYTDIAQVDLPIDGVSSQCYTMTLGSGNPGAMYLVKNGGNLIGINFDRVWEGTMSDLVFDPEICRNISLDVRYLLFVIKEVGHADYLFDEMVFAE